jgi:hypothetical protein
MVNISIKTTGKPLRNAILSKAVNQREEMDGQCVRNGHAD